MVKLRAKFERALIKLMKELNTRQLREAADFAEIVVVAVPSQYLRNVLFKVKDFSLDDKIFVSVAKGIEQRTLARPSEIIFSVLGNVHLVVLSGPSHAEEVARNLPTLVVVGSRDWKTSEVIQGAFRDRRFRIYIQNDVVGIELGGALKNVIAIGAGLCDGLGFGANTKAAVLTRGLLEMTQLGVRMGANPNTFFGLAGVGDLITTCFSEYGRNLRVGRELGQGRKLKEILSGMAMVADIVRIFQNYDFATQVLVASIRHPVHFLEAARMGADVATLPFNVIAQLLKHPLTDIGLEKFLADWQRASELR